MGQTVIITGANRGIGKALVEAYAKKGDSVYACARKENKEFEFFINNLNDSAEGFIKPIYFDLKNEDEIKQGMKTIFSDKTAIDVLINNAGINHYGLINMTTTSIAREIFDVNFFASMLIMQYVSKRMMKNKSGAIVNVASIAGLDSHIGDGVYGASKAALISLTKIFAAELGEQGIRVNAVAPGPVDTDMSDKYLEKLGESLYNNMAIKRLAKKEEIVSAIMFLASEAASYINGQVIRVDGGSL